MTNGDFVQKHLIEQAEWTIVTATIVTESVESMTV
jgi:hypothetical protein